MNNTPAVYLYRIATGGPKTVPIALSLKDYPGYARDFFSYFVAEGFQPFNHFLGYVVNILGSQLD